MKWLTLLAVMSFAGCGGSSTQQTTAATLQAGQWEFVATPEPGGKPIYLEANLVQSGATVYSTAPNTSLFQNGGTIGGLFSSCANFTVNGTVSTATLTGSLVSPSAPTTSDMFFATSIASTGKSAVNGTFSSSNSLCGLEPSQTAGTLTGYIVAPLSGKFSGTLAGVGQDQVTLQITQDSNFGFTATGTSVLTGVTTNLSFSPNAGTDDDVIGATVAVTGTGTNGVNGTSPYQIFGHINPAGTQIEIVATGHWGTETGTLTKQ